MSEGDKLPALPGFQTDIDRFTAKPVWAVFKYLECFEEDDEQAFEIPRHILQALANCFMSFASHGSNSLDDAFGGHTRMQWQTIMKGYRDHRIALDFEREWKEARQQPKPDRTGMPSERAYSKVAELHSMTEDNVRRIVKNVRRSRRDAAAAASMTPAGQITASPQKKLPTFIMFRFEEQLESERFTPMPVWAIFKYLECFNEDGEQAFEVPRHILRALAKYFNKFRSGRSGSLDEAFGGQTLIQRRRIEMNARDRGVLFDYWDAYDSARKRPKLERTGTPSERAYAEAAKQHGISQDAVKAIFRNAGKPTLRRKGRKPR
jgi:hypothetical protein